ncbi:hypothetical protein ACFE04_004532 [Oxalis oulophora]
MGLSVCVCRGRVVAGVSLSFVSCVNVSSSIGVVVVGRVRRRSVLVAGRLRRKRVSVVVAVGSGDGTVCVCVLVEGQHGREDSVEWQFGVEVVEGERVADRVLMFTNINNSSSSSNQRIDAPADLVWPFVRSFDNPQKYKHFIKSCNLRPPGDGGVGSIRDVTVISGLPASTSTERLSNIRQRRGVNLRVNYHIPEGKLKQELGRVLWLKYD